MEDYEQQTKLLESVMHLVGVFLVHIDLTQFRKNRIVELLNGVFQGFARVLAVNVQTFLDYELLRKPVQPMSQILPVAIIFGFKIQLA
jgi:hypothetical protein